MAMRFPLWLSLASCLAAVNAVQVLAKNDDVAAPSQPAGATAKVAPLGTKGPAPVVARKPTAPAETQKPPPPAAPQKPDPRPVQVVATQHTGWGRVSFVLRGHPAPEVRSSADGIEARFPAGVAIEAPSGPRLRETGLIETSDAAGQAVVHIRLTCHCESEAHTEEGILRLDIRPATAAPAGGTLSPASTTSSAATTATTPADIAATRAPPTGDGIGSGVAKTASRDVPTSGSTTQAQRTVASGAESTGNAPASAKPEPPGSAAPEIKSKPGIKPSPPVKSEEAAEMARLRTALTDKLARLNGTPVQERPGLVSDSAASRPIPATLPVQTDNEPPPAICLPPVTTAHWRGAGSFIERLVALRAELAASGGAAEDLATLAEFYLANGLGQEALAVATDGLMLDNTTDQTLRLTRDADVARLARGDRIDDDSPLLSLPPGCVRPDAPLWQALNAAAVHDNEGAARQPEQIAQVLNKLPEGMRLTLTARIIAGAGDNLNSLSAMAGVLRNSATELPEDTARRFLLQARIAQLTGDQTDYATYLAHAAKYDRTPAGIVARTRLAAIRALQDEPGAAEAEEILADTARVYRHELLGQEAAEQYAEAKLKARDYAAALAMADESAGPHDGARPASRGAELAARILRMLLVDHATPALPDDTNRIALFLRYGGYATPGEKGDDIRLAAARLMLARAMPEAALDTLKQLSNGAGGTPDAQRMLATAEAEGGDPSKALELLRVLPDDDSTHRVIAEALRRSDQPLAAARALDNATSLEDRANRASLLFEAQNWADAAAAYANLLGGPVPTAARDEMARRYAIAVTMTGQPAKSLPEKLPSDPGRMVDSVPVFAARPTGGVPTLSAIRAATGRAKQIETLLGPPPRHQGS
jgi:hypothetical protein